MCVRNNKRGGLSQCGQGERRINLFVILCGRPLWMAPNEYYFYSPREDLAKKVKPTSWQDMTSEDFGHVIHLRNTTYEEFISNQVNYCLKLKLWLFTKTSTGSEGLSIADKNEDSSNADVTRFFDNYYDVSART